MKKVSVIIPAFNKADFTVKAVESVLGQSYNNIETIVVDDGSTDDTQDKLKVFGDRIIYFLKENGGACSARNFGIKQATGEYIALLDCDDIYYPEKIEKSVKCLESDPDFGFVSTSAYKIDENDDIVSEWFEPSQEPSGWIFSRILIKNQICNSTVVARKECFSRVGYFDESIFIPADYDMWVRLAEVYKAGYVPERLTGYRVSNNYTILNLDQGIKESLYVIKKNINEGRYPSKAILNRRYATVYYNYARLYGAVNEPKKALVMFFKSARSDMSHPKIHKILAGLILSYLYPKKLNKILKDRFLYEPQSFKQK
jgi:glycosyltransferase involved in cell wall biosynthesis